MVVKTVEEYLPGILFLLFIGIISRIVADSVPGVNHLILAIVIGLIVGNTIGIPQWGDAGVTTHKLWLESGIVLMGVSIALDQVVEAGLQILVLIIVVSFCSIIILELLARTLFSVPKKVASLLAAGSSICGVSAVVAVAGAIRANQDQIAYAAGTILLFDALTLFIYPLIGQSLGLSDTAFGIWAGTTMFSTGPVAAAGFTISDTAGQWAVLVKLARNALIGAIVIIYTFYYMKYANSSLSSSRITLRSIWDTFPKFILGFFTLMSFANIGVLSESQILSLENASNWFFLVAFAGLGVEIRLAKLRSTGLTPILLVLTTLIIISISTLGLIVYLLNI